MPVLLFSGKLKSWTSVQARVSCLLAVRLTYAQMSAHWWSCPIRNTLPSPTSRWETRAWNFKFCRRVIAQFSFWKPTKCQTHLHLSTYDRALLWPSSWVQRLTWSAPHSPQRKASTACSAPQRWPASTSCSRSPSLAPPAASPKDFSTCPASQICSPPPSRRRRPRAAR